MKYLKSNLVSIWMVIILTSCTMGRNPNVLHGDGDVAPSVGSAELSTNDAVLKIVTDEVAGGMAKALQNPPKENPVEEYSVGWTHAWSRQMAGAISELSLARDARSVVVATQPDVDIEGSSKQFLLNKIHASGELLWQIPVKSPIRDLDVSADGSLIVVSDYEHEIYGLNENGKRIWTAEAMCRPRIVDSQLIVCYHDDDAEADVGFDLIDKMGRKSASFHLTPQQEGDILAFKLAADQRNLGVGLTSGQVDFFQVGRANPLWKRSVPGEIVDIAVSSEAQPKVAVLVTRPKSKRPNMKTPSKPKAYSVNQRVGKQDVKQPVQQLWVFDSKGNVIAHIEPSFYAIQVEFAPNAQGIFVYGNGMEGQNLAFYSMPGLREEWKRSGISSAVYTSSITVTSDYVFQGYEDEGLAPTHSGAGVAQAGAVVGKDSAGKESAEKENKDVKASPKESPKESAKESKVKLLVFDYKGKLQSQVSIQAEETAHLYDVKVTPDSQWIVVATDDGKVQGFRRVK